MKPATPVLPNDKFKTQEVVVAENQPEYENLPQINLRDKGVGITRWELSDEELEQVKESRSVWLALWHFNQPQNPVWLSVTEPTVESFYQE